MSHDELREPMKATEQIRKDCEVCILAGGLSSRMGRDKSRLRLGRKSLIGHIRATARGMGLPVRVIRRDLIPRCGPLGGIYTALKTSRAARVLFLSCDMPFVSEQLLGELLARIRPTVQGLFVVQEKRVGFPFVLKVETLGQLEELQARRQFSLQALARTLKAETLAPKLPQAGELMNVNTPADWARARNLWRKLSGTEQITRRAAVG